MKKILIIVLLFTAFSNAQQQDINVLNAQNILGFVQPVDQSMLQIDPGNSVFVEQIGEGNSLFTDVTSQQSQVTISQFGSDNFIFAQYEAATINASLSQNGLNNSIIDVSIQSGTETNSIISQDGDNLNLLKIGSNSLSNNLQINMQGSNKTMVMINY